MIIQWIIDNKEFLFGGVGLLIFSVIGYFLKRLIEKNEVNNSKITMQQYNKKNSNNIQINEINLNKEKRED